MRILLFVFIAVALISCSQVESQASNVTLRKLRTVADQPDFTTLDAKDTFIALEGFTFVVLSPASDTGSRLLIWVDLKNGISIKAGDTVELDLSGIIFTRRKDGVLEATTERDFPYKVVPNQSTDPTFSSGTPPAGQESRHP
jgi:hypothetical protein